MEPLFYDHPKNQASSMVVKHRPCLLTLKKRIQAFKTKMPEETPLHLLLGSQDQRLSAEQDQLPYGSSGTSSGNCQRDGHLHGAGMSHPIIASPKPSFRAAWRVGDAVVGRRNVGWTTSKSGHPSPCQNCSQGPPAGKKNKQTRKRISAESFLMYTRRRNLSRD